MSYEALSNLLPIIALTLVTVVFVIAWWTKEPAPWLLVFFVTFNLWISEITNYAHHP